MKVRIPLGQVEGQRLEFKGREALKKPQLLSRAVVAMLNADGGDVWVGLREEGGRAVQVEPVVDARAKMGSLWNHLIDTIDPPPLSGEKGEIKVESVPASEDEEVLRIRVAPGERGPYAQLKEGGRFFFIRAGDRVRSMTREEIAQGFQSEPRANSADDSASNKALESLRREREGLQDLGKELFWIRLQPEADLDLDLQSPELKRLLVDPAASGNRSSGWMVVNPYLEPKLEGGSLSIEHEHYGSTRVYRNGCLEYRGPLDRLRHENPGGPRLQIYPFALLELPVSLMRLGAHVYSTIHDKPSERGPRAKIKRLADGRVWADLGLFNIMGWKLLPYSPRAYGYLFKHEEKTFPGKSLLLDRQLAFNVEEVVGEPDRCAFRLIQQVYQAFGYSEDRIPSEFDQTSGKLRIGDG